MEYCGTKIEGLTPVYKDSALIQMLTQGQWNEYIHSIRWMLEPHPSDEGSNHLDFRFKPWMGGLKTFFWIAAAIGIGLLLAQLSG